MEDEILKHTEKIYKTVKSRQHSLSEKLKEISIEIFIIVFAVTLSIWLHSWSEHNHQADEAREFLNDVKDDLSKDLSSMKTKRAALDSIFKTCVQISQLKEDDKPGNNISMNFSLNTFKVNDGNYQGFKSSGKIGYIENKQLKKMILSYYEKDLPAIYDVDKYQYTKHLEVWELLNSSDVKKMFTNPLFRSKIILDAQITEALIKAYDGGIEKASEIDREIGKI